MRAKSILPPIANKASSHKSATCITCWNVPGASDANLLNNGVFVLLNSKSVISVTKPKRRSNKNTSGKDNIVNKAFMAKTPMSFQLTFSRPASKISAIPTLRTIYAIKTIADVKKYLEREVLFAKTNMATNDTKN